MGQSGQVFDHLRHGPRCPDVLFPCLPATDGFVWGFTYETLMMVIADRYDALPRTITAEPRR